MHGQSKFGCSIHSPHSSFHSHIRKRMFNTLCIFNTLSFFTAASRFYRVKVKMNLKDEGLICRVVTNQDPARGRFTCSKGPIKGQYIEVTPSEKVAFLCMPRIRSKPLPSKFPRGLSTLIPSLCNRAKSAYHQLTIWDLCHAVVV